MYLLRIAGFIIVCTSDFCIQSLGHKTGVTPLASGFSCAQMLMGEEAIK